MRRPRRQARALRAAAITAAAIGILAGSVVAPARAEAIKIGLTAVAGLAVPFVADAKGYFNAEGLRAEIVDFDAAQPVAVAVVSGSIDFGVTALTAGFYNLAGQGEPQIIGAAAHEFPGFQLQANLASSRAYAAGLTSLKNLPGHSFAVTGMGGPAVYVVGTLVAEKYGFDSKSVRFVPVSTIPNIISSITGGQVDATQTSLMAGLASLIQRGDVKLLGWVGDETPWQYGVALTSTRTANEKRDLVERFLRAYRKGARDYHDAFTGPGEKRVDGPTAPEIEEIVAKYTNQSIDGVKLAIPYVDADARLDVADVLHQIAWYKSQNLVKPQTSGEAMIDRRYVTALPDR